MWAAGWPYKSTYARYEFTKEHNLDHRYSDIKVLEFIQELTATVTEEILLIGYHTGWTKSPLIFHIMIKELVLYERNVYLF